MSFIKAELRTLGATWDRFWFGPVDLYNLGLFRCVTFSILFVMYTLRMFEIKLLFFNEGLMPFSLAKEFAPPFYQPNFYLFPAHDQLLFGAHILFLALLLLGALGFLRRWSTWFVFVLHLMFIQRNFTAIYGADLISTFWLFYLSLADHSRSFSLRKTEPCPVAHKDNDLLTSVAYRLIQLQLCIVYAYTGMEKLKGATWWEGTAVWKVLGNTQLAPFDFSFMAQVPVVIAFLTYSTLLFEIFFAAAVWYKPLRKYWLTTGAIFHLMAAWSMGLHFFSILMICAYIPFISSDFWRGLFGRFFSRRYSHSH